MEAVSRSSVPYLGAVLAAAIFRLCFAAQVLDILYADWCQSAQASSADRWDASRDISVNVLSSLGRAGVTYAFIDMPGDSYSAAIRRSCGTLVMQDLGVARDPATLSVMVMIDLSHVAACAMLGNGSLLRGSWCCQIHVADRKSRTVVFGDSCR